MANLTRFSRFYRSALALSGLVLSVSAFANTEEMNVDPNYLTVYPNINASIGCYGSKFTVRLQNFGPETQACNVNCKHIITRDTFSAFVQPYSSVTLFGSTDHGKCSVSCASQVYGVSPSVYVEGRC